MPRLDRIGRGQILRILSGPGGILDNPDTASRTERIAALAGMCGYEYVLSEEEQQRRNPGAGREAAPSAGLPRDEEDLLSAPRPSRAVEIDSQEIEERRKNAYHITRAAAGPAAAISRISAFTPQNETKSGDSPFSRYLSIDKPLDRDQIASKDPIPPCAPLLVSRSVTRPFLKRALGRPRNGAVVDLEKCVRRLSRGGQLDAVPFIQRIRWARRIDVLLDHSHRLSFNWLDQDDLRGFILDWCGRGCVRVFVVAGAPTEQVFVPAGGARMEQGAYAPPGGTAVLALSDLGCLCGSEVIRQSWLELGVRLQKAGCTPIALLPCPPRRWASDLPRVWRMACWDRGPCMQPGAGASRQPRASVDELNEDQETAREILMLLSPFLCIQPGMVREIVRHELFSQDAMDIGAEYEIWNSKDFYDQTPFDAFFEPEPQRMWQQKLAEKYYAPHDSRRLKEKMRAVIGIAARYHAMLSPALVNVELLLLKAVAPELASEYRQALAQQGADTESFENPREYIDRLVAGVAQRRFLSDLDSIAAWSRNLLGRIAMIDGDAMAGIADLTALAMKANDAELSSEELPETLDLSKCAWIPKPALRNWLLFQKGEIVRIYPDGAQIPFFIGKIQARLPQVELVYETGAVENAVPPSIQLELNDHSSPVIAVAMHPNGHLVISGSEDKTLKLWDLRSGNCLRTFEGHSNGVTSVALLPNGKEAISGSFDKTLKLWNIESGECIRTFEGHSNRVRSVAVLPNGKEAISGSADKTLKLWNIESGECIRTFEGHLYGVNSVAVLPNSKKAISGASDSTLKLWNIESGECVRTFEGHSNWVNSVAVLPNGKEAISASYDNTLKLWNIESGECIRTFEGHSKWVNSVAVLPNGKEAISASHDSTLKLWNIESGKCIRTFKGHSEWVNSVAILSDCKKAVSGSSDKTIIVWNLFLKESLTVQRRLPAWSSDSTEGEYLSFPLKNLKTLKSDQDTIEIEEIGKPQWASEVKRNSDELTVLYAKDGVEKKCIWFNPGRYKAAHGAAGAIEMSSEFDIKHGFWWDVDEYEDWRANGFRRPEWASGFGTDEYGMYAEFSLKGVIQRMRWIPPGKFMMGSPESEADRETNETQHEVILTQGFWLADTACTQELWEAVMGENPSSFKDDPHNPVERVSWEMVCGKGPHGGEGDFFLKRLNAALPGLDLCLPTEAQWEYACRAGTETAFWWGNELTTEDANYNGKYPYAGGAKGEYREKTVPVKTFKRNARGLWQMHGNVWEWCKDWFGPYPRGTAIDPGGADTGASRVLRGGGWLDYGRDLRSAYRFFVQPSDAWLSLGFRLARGHSEVQQEQASSRAQRSEPVQVPPARRTGEAERSRSAAAGGRNFFGKIGRMLRPGSPDE